MIHPNPPPRARSSELSYPATRRPPMPQTTISISETSQRGLAKARTYILSADNLVELSIGDTEYRKSARGSARDLVVR